MVRKKDDISWQGLFEVKSFDIVSGLICLRRVYDDNNILLNNYFSDKSLNFKRISYNTFFKDFIILDEKEDHNTKIVM